jgi:glucose-1-phosphate adenylyltransferase
MDTNSRTGGGYVRDSIIGRNVYIDSGARVEETVILGDTVVEEGAKLLRAIVDHENVITRGEEIGYDQERDRSRYHVDESGIVVRRGYHE